MEFDFHLQLGEFLFGFVGFSERVDFDDAREERGHG